MSESRKVIMLILWLVVPYIMLPIVIYKKTKSLWAASVTIIIPFILVVTILSFIPDENVVAESVPIKTEIPTVKPTEVPTVVPTIKPTEVPNVKLSAEAAMLILKESYKDIANVTYNKSIKTISITPLDANITKGVLLAKNGNQEFLKQWNGIVSNLQETSSNIKGDVILSVINYSNTKNSLLMISNGVVLYNSAQ